MPVGTLATVKTLDPEELNKIGAQIILGNTYHLLLRPGEEVFRKFGGIHAFMNWQKPVLTDSGGFQIFSLTRSRKITEEGAIFQSYVDGTLFKLTPERSLDMQKAINSDIMMVLDQCIESTATLEKTRNAMELTHRWALRSLQAHQKNHQALFAIIQGGVFEALRKQSVDFLTQHDFDGFAIGGLAVGETKRQREDFTELVTEVLPKNKPRYLMGVGTPLDLLEAVKRGVDMFDCIIPTKMAQQGNAYTSLGLVKLAQTAYRLSEEKLDPACQCQTCQTYSRGYLHHLTKCRETLGWRALALHNLHFYQQFMSEMRQAIRAGRFLAYYDQCLQIWQTVEEEKDGPTREPAEIKFPKRPKVPTFALESSDP